jgi:CRP-like cAMP-binding protein
MPRRFADSLSHYAPLGEQDRQAIEAVFGPVRTVPAGAVLVERGVGAGTCTVLLRGQAFRHKTLRDGRRQIMSFHAPGDLLDLQRLFLSMDSSVTMLTPGEIAQAPRRALLDAMHAHPAVAEALWRVSLIEAAIFREWMVGMGQRSAYTRIAHLLCEIFVRLKAAGQAQGDRCPFPATQGHLSDSLGLSVVHTNRILQALRRDGLIVLEGHELTILDWPRLAKTAEFDPDYLHIGEKAAA